MCSKIYFLLKKLNLNYLLIKKVSLFRISNGIANYYVEPETVPFDITPMFGDIFAQRNLPNGHYLFNIVAIDCFGQVCN